MHQLNVIIFYWEKKKKKSPSFTVWLQWLLATIRFFSAINHCWI